MDFINKNKYYLKIKNGLTEIKKTQTREDIALSFAIGVFWGILPTFGTAFVWAMLSAKLINKSKFTAILGTLISNPFTFMFFYSSGSLVGAKFAGITLSKNAFLKLLLENNLNILILKFIFGYLFFTILISILFYFIILFSIPKKKKETKFYYSKK